MEWRKEPVGEKGEFAKTDTLKYPTPIASLQAFSLYLHTESLLEVFLQISKLSLKTSDLPV